MPPDRKNAKHHDEPEVLLVDTEEDHAHWLEQQLGLIRMVGLENYLQSQMSGAA